MNEANGDALHRRIAELEAENARLRTSLESVKAERRELSDKLYGPFPEDQWTTEEEMVEIMKTIVPGEGMKFFAEMGLLPRKTT
jgi:predicted nuclease with TOPRIM domain